MRTGSIGGVCQGRDRLEFSPSNGGKKLRPSFCVSINVGQVAPNADVYAPYKRAFAYGFKLRGVVGIALSPDTLKTKKEPDFSGSSDKVIYALTKALRRVARPTFIRCPNLTTSKTFLPTLNEQRNF